MSELSDRIERAQAEGAEAARQIREAQKAAEAIGSEARDAENNLPFVWERRIGETLREIREGMGWSQQFAVERLASYWGIQMHQTTLAKLEAGKRPLRLAELFALASTYHLNVMTVLHIKGIPEMPSAELLDARYVDEQRELDDLIEQAKSWFATWIELIGTRRANLDAMAIWLRRQNMRPDGEHPEAS